jgi:hypothetical protein
MYRHRSQRGLSRIVNMTTITNGDCADLFFPEQLVHISGDSRRRPRPTDVHMAYEHGTVIFHTLIINMSETADFNTTQKKSITVPGQNYVFEMSPI